MPLLTIPRGPSNQRRKLRTVNKSVSWSSGGRDTIEVPTDGGWQKRLVFTIAGTITFGAGSDNVRENIKPGDEAALFGTLKIRSNNRDLFNGTLYELAQLNKVWYGRDVVTTPTLADGSTAVVTFKRVIVFSFLDAETLRGYDTLHDGRNVKFISADFSFGTVADFTSASGVTVSATVTATAETTFGYEGNVDLKRHTRNKGRSGGASANFGVDIDVGPFTIVSHLVRVTDPSTGADAVGKLNRIKIETGGDDPLDIDAETLRQTNNLLDRTSADLLQTSADLQYFADPHRSSTADNRAWYYIPHVDPVDRMATEAFDADGVQTYRLVFDITGDYVVDVITTIREEDNKRQLIRRAA